MEWILTYIIPVLLASDALFLSISGGVTMRPFNSLQAIKIAGIFAITLSISGILAFLLAQLILPLVLQFSELTGHVLLLFIGIRFINDARKIKNEERTFLLQDHKILFISAFAASFIIFLAFFGLGFIQTELQKSLLTLGISVFIFSFSGIFIGSHYQPLRLGRSSKFAAGLLMAIFIIIHYINQL